MSDLLTIDDLRRRWGLPDNRAVAAAVKKKGVPVLMLGLSWRRARFHANVIDEWERSNHDIVAEIRMTTTSPSPRPKSKRLGDWRD